MSEPPARIPRVAWIKRLAARATAERAFDPLRQASRIRNRKLCDIAADIFTKVEAGPGQ
jgi:hypothetical protein